VHFGIVITFVPWILYWVICGPSTWRIAAFVAFAAAVILMIPSFERGRPKIMELGTVAFFLIIGLLSLFVDRQDARWLEDWSQVISSGALALIALGSLAIGRPFTLEYAKDHTPKEMWTKPGFIHVNQVLTAVWGIVFVISAVLGVIAETSVSTGDGRDWLNWIIPMILIVGAIRFTSWYPAYYRRMRKAEAAEANRAGNTA
jgi:hypothetical protein